MMSSLPNKVKKGS